MDDIMGIDAAFEPDGRGHGVGWCIRMTGARATAEFEQAARRNRAFAASIPDRPAPRWRGTLDRSLGPP
jgi:hypothetical protein